MAEYITKEQVRLINAEQLSKAIHDNVPAPYEDASWAKENCLAEIEAAPTVDAVPVVHGRWVGAPLWGSGNCPCSECGSQYIIYVYPHGEIREKYCPNCGARMDGAECH